MNCPVYKDEELFVKSKVAFSNVIDNFSILGRSLKILAMLTESGDFADLSTIQPMLETLYSSFVSDFNNLVDIAKIYTGYNISKIVMTTDERIKFIFKELGIDLDEKQDIEKSDCQIHC
mgnify:CR=1 FL=1